MPVLCAEEALKNPEPNGTKWETQKRIWARDMLWTDAPKLEVAEWLTEPDEENVRVAVPLRDGVEESEAEKEAEGLVGEAEREAVEVGE